MLNRLQSFVSKMGRSWAVRSLAVGAAATVIDVAVSSLAYYGLNCTTRISVLMGVVTGALVAFVGNRVFAFPEDGARWLGPFVRFLLSTGVAILIHGQLVVWLHEGWGMPFVVSKLLADFLVFTLGQLLVMRFVVFPSKALFERNS